MIGLRTLLTVADNTGARRASCIGVIGRSGKKFGNVGDIITCNIKEATPDAIIKKGEVVKAVVVLKPEEKASEDEIIQFCKQHLASFKKPRSVDFVDELPIVGSGMMRIARGELRERYRKAAEKGGN